MLWDVRKNMANKLLASPCVETSHPEVCAEGEWRDLLASVSVRSVSTKIENIRLRQNQSRADQTELSTSD